MAKSNAFLAVLPTREVFGLVTTSLVKELVLGTDITPPREELRRLAFHDEVSAVSTVVWTRVALLVVDVEFLKVLLVLGAEVFIVDAPAHGCTVVV